MLAKLKNRRPTTPKKVYQVHDYLPWARPFHPGVPLPFPLAISPGNYTLDGQTSGRAHVQFFGAPIITRVSVNYSDYSDDDEYLLNGYEDVTVSITPPNVWENNLHWQSDIVQSKDGVTTGTKVTSEAGFYLRVDAMRNIFQANGTLTTVIGGERYEQPVNGT